MDDAELNALALLVLQEATHATRQDLKEVARQLEAIHRAKSALRELLERVAQEDEQLANDLRAVYDDSFVSTDLDGLAAAELQMEVERRERMLETLSNLLKRISSEEDAIVENLK